LVSVEAEGDRLTEGEINVMLRLSAVTGTQTTTSLLGNGLLALPRHPEQMQKLRENPGLLPTAIERS